MFFLFLLINLIYCFNNNNNQNFISTFLVENMVLQKYVTISNATSFYVNVYNNISSDSLYIRLYQCEPNGTVINALRIEKFNEWNELTLIQFDLEYDIEFYILSNNNITLNLEWSIKYCEKGYWSENDDKNDAEICETNIDNPYDEHLNACPCQLYTHYFNKNTGKCEECPNNTYRPKGGYSCVNRLSIDLNLLYLDNKINNNTITYINSEVHKLLTIDDNYINSDTMVYNILDSDHNNYLKSLESHYNYQLTNNYYFPHIESNIDILNYRYYLIVIIVDTTDFTIFRSKFKNLLEKYRINAVIINIGNTVPSEIFLNYDFIKTYTVLSEEYNKIIKNIKDVIDSAKFEENYLPSPCNKNEYLDKCTCYNCESNYYSLKGSYQCSYCGESQCNPDSFSYVFNVPVSGEYTTNLIENDNNRIVIPTNNALQLHMIITEVDSKTDIIIFKGRIINSDRKSVSATSGLKVIELNEDDYYTIEFQSIKRSRVTFQYELKWCESGKYINQDRDSCNKFFIEDYLYYFIGGGALLLIIIIGSIICCCCCKKKKEKSSKTLPEMISNDKVDLTPHKYDINKRNIDDNITSKSEIETPNIVENNNINQIEKEEEEEGTPIIVNIYPEDNVNNEIENGIVIPPLESDDDSDVFTLPTTIRKSSNKISVTSRSPIKRRMAVSAKSSPLKLPRPVKQQPKIIEENRIDTTKEDIVNENDINININANDNTNENENTIKDDENTIKEGEISNNKIQILPPEIVDSDSDDDFITLPKSKADKVVLKK